MKMSSWWRNTWARNSVLFPKFLRSLRLLPVPSLLLVALYALLSFTYPGQNTLQTLILHPGPVKSYDLTALPVAPYPVSDGTNVPSVTARSVVVQDGGAGRSLMYAKNPDLTLMPASTTKVMTALVALDYYHDLGEILTVKNEDHAIGSTMNLKKGETITVHNLLYGLLVHSGNDAALALADNHQGGYYKFIEAMNAKAKSLHLDHTVYRNPSGVEQYGHVTTARDLAVLAAVAMGNPLIRDIVQTRSITVTDTTGSIPHFLTSTNELLGAIPGLIGLKTGWTENAGECLVTYVDRDGHQVITVVLNSTDRFGDSKALIDWAYSHHTWQPVVK